jgi:predicted ABC-type ATPase
MSSAKTNSKNQLRLRVFAGPNGSGKSTVIQNIREKKADGRPIDFGIYVNADDIAKELRDGAFFFSKYEITTDNKEFTRIVLGSGLINNDFTEATFKKCYSFRANSIQLKQLHFDERLAQIIADFLRKKLLQEKKKFSFETVFSHPSKLDIMRQAADQGYKVYLYFVSTESPDINIFRVAARKLKGGHDVPKHKIKNRYRRSLELLYDASQIAYQAYYFDNSEDLKMFAHFKRKDGKLKWDARNKRDDPSWFKKYYSA